MERKGKESEVKERQGKERQGKARHMEHLVRIPLFIRQLHWGQGTDVHPANICYLVVTLAPLSEYGLGRAFTRHAVFETSRYSGTVWN